MERQAEQLLGELGHGYGLDFAAGDLLGQQMLKRNGPDRRASAIFSPHGASEKGAGIRLGLADKPESSASLILSSGPPNWLGLC
jgi:hypothetical protein